MRSYADHKAGAYHTASADVSQSLEAAEDDGPKAAHFESASARRTAKETELATPAARVEGDSEAILQTQTKKQDLECAESNQETAHECVTHSETTAAHGLGHTIFKAQGSSSAESHSSPAAAAPTNVIPLNDLTNARPGKAVLGPRKRKRAEDYFPGSSDDDSPVSTPKPRTIAATTVPRLPEVVTSPESLPSPAIPQPSNPFARSSAHLKSPTPVEYTQETASSTGSANARGHAEKVVVPAKQQGLRTNKNVTKAVANIAAPLATAKAPRKGATETKSSLGSSTKSPSSSAVGDPKTSSVGADGPAPPVRDTADRLYRLDVVQDVTDLMSAAFRVKEKLKSELGDPGSSSDLQSPLQAARRALYTRFDYEFRQLLRLRAHLLKREKASKPASTAWPDLVDVVVREPVCATDAAWMSIVAVAEFSLETQLDICKAFEIGTEHGWERGMRWIKVQIAELWMSPIHLQVVDGVAGVWKSKFLQGVEAMAERWQARPSPLQAPNELYLKWEAAAQSVVDNRKVKQQAEGEATADGVCNNLMQDPSFNNEKLREELARPSTFVAKASQPTSTAVSRIPESPTGMPVDHSSFSEVNRMPLGKGLVPVVWQVREAAATMQPYLADENVLVSLAHRSYYVDFQQSLTSSEQADMKR